jgi:hypothetical protein
VGGKGVGVWVGLFAEEEWEDTETQKENNTKKNKKKTTHFAQP